MIYQPRGSVLTATMILMVLCVFVDVFNKTSNAKFVHIGLAVPSALAVHEVVYAGVDKGTLESRFHL